MRAIFSPAILLHIFLCLGTIHAQSLSPGADSADAPAVTPTGAPATLPPANAMTAPAAPNNHILDPDQILGATYLEKIEVELKAAEQSEALDLYVAAYQSCGRKGPAAVSVELLDHWVGKKLGAVVVFSELDHQFGIAVSKPAQRFLGAGAQLRIGETAARNFALTRKPGAAAREALLALAYDIREGQREVEARLEKTEKMQRGAIWACAIIPVLIGILLLLRAAQANFFGKKYSFPILPDVKPRFGGTYTGGHCTTRTLRRSPGN